MNATSTSTDRIEKEILLQASQSRVWRALTDSQEFGSWFGMQLNGPFLAGQQVSGNMTYKGQPLTLHLWVEKIEAESYFSYRWHPFAVDTEVDYSAEPTTLIEFHLSEEGGATRLKVSESGFDQIPAERRDLAFRMNDGGWMAQLRNIERYLAG